MKADVLRALRDGLVLADGAMGTELEARGLSVPFERYNLERPDRVLELHRAYRAAGARLLRTNTFLARDPDVVRAGVRLAREAAGSELWVAGAIGPGGPRAADLAACDLLILETFTKADALREALREAKAVGLPVVAQMAGAPDLPAMAGADVIGVNCVELAAAVDALEELKRDGRPLSAFPSAGLPGRRVSPSAFAAGGARLAAAGVRLLGGCCGAGPAHAQALAEAVA